MLSALIPSVRSYPAMLLAEQLVHQRYVHPGPLVLRTAPLKFPTPTTDRDRTVSRRSEPSSRTALMGEQPNPWDLLQPQDAMSRHRGAKPPRRCGLLGEISLLSPGRRPPQSNCPPDTVPIPDYGTRLEPRYDQGGIPTAPPPKLALRFQRLPPILYRSYPNPISSCSKAPWGLSVLSRVTCIFTGIKISPDLSLRQRPSRYAIRAGQNLPDKEFRYLRTVIVTAAVYWGFGSQLR
ncbi:hydrolase, partial [Mucor ambiguus]